MTESIYVVLMGGLGNQMFQVAFGLALSRALEKKLVLSPNRLSEHGNPRKIGWDSVLKNCLSLRSFEGAPQTILPEDAIEKNWSVLKTGGVYLPGSLTLYGYFQHAMYFSGLQDELRVLFDCVSASRKEELIYKYSLGSSKIVAVHFRFMEVYNSGLAPNFTIDWKKCVPLDFYKKILKDYFYKKCDDTKCDDTKFLLFHDSQYDISEWITSLDNELGLGLGSSLMVCEEDYEEMWIMGQCSDVICPTSTFSWWASYLGKTERVYVPTADWLEDSIGFYKLEMPNWIQVSRV